MVTAILDIQCIMGANSKYLIKEMASKHTQTPYSAKSKALYRNYHQLSLDCGDVEYSEIERILKSLNFECMYVKAEEKRAIIQDFIPKVKIIEMGADLECPRLDQLHAKTVGNIHRELRLPCFIYHKDLDYTQCTLY
ncbi:Uncharacterized protein FWK35_00012979 [Aphis craccivora]|uniref:Uncharacterized protein n=1 Tax=Aphis craccivora TaxID=307492 RepID=A0A6G0YCP2_APHCR|nr:Uncharacterized protein FWK35_00012979 [Aphis craccivora]